MASAGRRGLRRRSSAPAPILRVQAPPRRGIWGSAVINRLTPAQHEALRASAANVDPSDRTEAKVQRMLRQGWQSDAWNFRDSIGELRYAVNFLANCTARMRLYPAVFPVGGESDAPVAMTEAKGVPEEVISAAGQAMSDLGNGRTAISGMLHAHSTNKSVAGEAYLLGRTDEQTGKRLFSIRSVDELVVYDEKWHLREVPDDRENAVIPWIELDPLQTVIARMWTPHPRFQLLADSPVRAMLDDCESLQISRRTIRAVGRSRLASRGILKVPDELSIKAPIDENDDPEADPFMLQLADAMMAPIVNEGTADGVVPIVVRGPAEALGALELLDMAQGFDEWGVKVRAELVGILAITFDLPREVIEGIVDLNHWSAWQVDDNTFRHHVEPHVISCCDDLSAAYFRPYLAAAGVEDFWAQRAVLWYDPTELVTHPDRAADAEKAFGNQAISFKAYRDATGFTDEDAPSIEEIELRRVMDIRALPLNLLMEYARRSDPTLVVPPITQAGEVPGIKPGGVDVGVPPVAPAPPGAPPVLAPAGKPPVEHSDAPVVPGPPPANRPLPAAPAITAAGEDMHSGVMVALYPPPDIANQLALPGGEAAEELHVTLAFLGDEIDLQDPDGLKAAVEAWANGTAAVAGEISGVGLFTAGPDAVTYLSVDLPSLPDARQKLVDAVAAAGAQPSEEHGFTPHMTLDYADRVGDVAPDVGGTQLTFTSVSCVIGEQRTDYQLAAAITAAGQSATNARRLSQRLQSIDAQLRARLQTAANAAMLRQLERAGAKLRSKVARDETLRARIAHRANERVPAILGRDVVTAAGFSPADLISPDWSALRSQFYDWTAAAQDQALAVALRIARLTPESPEAAGAQAALEQGRDAGWQLLQDSLTGLGEHLLYSPDPNAGPGDWADLNPDALVPAGTIRGALALAGGATTDLLRPGDAGSVALQAPVGQIGTGQAIADLITSAGGQQEGYEWVHGPSLQPFAGHEDLDGTEFANFDDEALANTDGWPDNAYFMPGDHDGCLCDFMPIYLSPEE